MRTSPCVSHKLLSRLSPWSCTTDASNLQCRYADNHHFGFNRSKRSIAGGEPSSPFSISARKNGLRRNRPATSPCAVIPTGQSCERKTSTPVNYEREVTGYYYSFNSSRIKKISDCSYMREPENIIFPNVIDATHRVAIVRQFFVMTFVDSVSVSSLNPTYWKHRAISLPAR